MKPPATLGLEGAIPYLLLIWLGGSLIGGAALAGLTKQIHQSISFKKSWLYFSALLAAIVAAVFGIALR